MGWKAWRFWNIQKIYRRYKLRLKKNQWCPQNPNECLILLFLLRSSYSRKMCHRHQIWFNILLVFSHVCLQYPLRWAQIIVLGYQFYAKSQWSSEREKLTAWIFLKISCFCSKPIKQPCTYCKRSEHLIFTESTVD